MEKQFQIVPASSGTLLSLIGIGVLILCSLIPAWLSQSWVVLGIVSAVIVFILLLFSWIGFSARNAKFIISSSDLLIRADMYSRRIPLADLQKERATLINLDQQDSYRPVLRTNGVGLPGYGSGWFTLNNGDRALIFLTYKKAVAYIPTNQDYCLLLSVSKPQDLIDTLRKIS